MPEGNNFACHSLIPSWSPTDSVVGFHPLGVVCIIEICAMLTNYHYLCARQSTAWTVLWYTCLVCGTTIAFKVLLNHVLLTFAQSTFSGYIFFAVVYQIFSLLIVLYAMCTFCLYNILSVQLCFIAWWYFVFSVYLSCLSCDDVSVIFCLLRV